MSKLTHHGNSFEERVRSVTDGIADLLIAKNAAYGNSALDPVRIFSSVNATEQINVRIDDKLSRIARGHDFGEEDVDQDLIGYLVLRILSRESF